MNRTNQLNKIRKSFKNELHSIYEDQECDSLFRICFEHVIGITFLKWKIDPVQIIEDHITEFNKIISRLKRNEPIQYILGESEFYGNTFVVSPAVLIPRQETEELVQLIKQKHKADSGKILEVGVGSGCIAITIKKKLPEMQVFGIDISIPALEIANQNRVRLNADVHFFQDDILNPSHSKYEDQYDILVSNPPYVRESEKKMMKQNVLDYEPISALFVSNHQSLIFYEAILDFSQSKLKSGGWIYFEINEYLADQMQTLLEKEGFESILIHKDLNGKNRMLSARKKAKV